jgi:FkbM family methyltransferase
LKRIIETSGYNALVKGKYGYVLYNKNDMYVGRSIEKYGEFCEGEPALFRQICTEGSVVVEAGANIGVHTMSLSRFVGDNGRIYAFEPQRIVFQTLCANMALNSINNVECFQMAVSDHQGHVLIPDIRYDIEGNFGGVSLNSFNVGSRVQQVALDLFIDTPNLRLLKVDVEGMEHEVITGARSLIGKHRPILYVENDRPEKSKALIELIQSLDYRLFWHTPMLFNPDNYAGDKENIYPGIVSLNMLCIHNSIEMQIDGLTEITDPAYHPFGK